MDKLAYMLGYNYRSLEKLSARGPTSVTSDLSEAQGWGQSNLFDVPDIIKHPIDTVTRWGKKKMFETMVPMMAPVLFGGMALGGGLGMLFGGGGNNDQDPKEKSPGIQTYSGAPPNLGIDPIAGQWQDQRTQEWQG